MKIHSMKLFLACLFAWMLIFTSSCEGDKDRQSETLTGYWVSKGDDLSYLQENLDSVVIFFDYNNQFEMYTYYPGVDVQKHEGVYIVQNVQFGLNQWLILDYHDGRVEEGLFQFHHLSDKIKIEMDLVQTEPDLGHIPPDPERGIGSSSLGTVNVQWFVKISQ